MEDCTQVLDESFLDNLDAPDIGRLKIGSLSIDGTFYDIFRGENVIGRDQLSDIVIKSNSISSKHAVIEVEDWDTHILYDCGSTNKTRLGKVVLKPNVMYGLQGGEDIYFADIKAKYIKLENAQASANGNDSGSETGSESMLNQDPNDTEGDIHEDDSRISHNSSESKIESLYEKSGDYSKSVSELNDSSLFEENDKVREVSRVQVVDTSLDDSTDDEEFFILPSQTTKQFGSVKQESKRNQSKINNPILTEDVFGPGMADQNQIHFNSNLKITKSEINENKDIFEQETEPPEQPLISDDRINNGKDQEIYDESDNSQSIFNAEATEAGPNEKNIPILNSSSIFEAETQDVSDKQIRNNASNQKPKGLSDNRDLFEAETELDFNGISDNSRDKINRDDFKVNTSFNNDIFNAETELPDIDFNINKKQNKKIKTNKLNLSIEDFKINSNVNKGQTSLDNDEFEMSELAVSSAFTESNADENQQDINEETHSEGSKTIARSELKNKLKTSECSTTNVRIEQINSKNNSPVGTEDISDCLTQVNNNLLEVNSPPKNGDRVDSLANYEAQVSNADKECDDTNDGMLANCETQVNNVNIKSNETSDSVLANCETQVNNVNIKPDETNNGMLGNCETQVYNANIEPNEINEVVLANCETQVNANIEPNETNNGVLANCETQVNANIESDKNRIILENETSAKKSIEVIGVSPSADSKGVLQVTAIKHQTVGGISEVCTQVNSNITENNSKPLKKQNDNALEVSLDTVETQVIAVINACDTKTNSKNKATLENVNSNSKSLNNPNIRLSLKEHLKNTNQKETFDTTQVAKTEITENFTLLRKNENNGNVSINDEEICNDNTQVYKHLFETKEMPLIEQNENSSQRCNDATAHTEINEAVQSGSDRKTFDKISTAVKDDNNIEGSNPTELQNNQIKQPGVETGECISKEEDSSAEQNTQLNINIVKKETVEYEESYSKPNSTVNNLKGDNTFLEETQPNLNLNRLFEKKIINKSEDIAEAATERLTGCTRSNKAENTYLEDTQLNLNLNRIFGQERINESENIAEAATQLFPGGTRSDKSEDSDDTDVDDGIKTDLFIKLPDRETKQACLITTITSNNVEKNTKKENENIDSDENSNESDSLLATMPLDIDDINSNTRQSSEDKANKGNAFETLDKKTEVSSLKIKNKLGTKSGKVEEDTTSTNSCFNTADMDICSTVGNKMCISTISNSDSTRKINCSIVKSKTTKTPLQCNILLTKIDHKPLDKQITSIMEEESIQTAQSRRSKKLFCEREKYSDDIPTEISFLNQPCSSSTPFRAEDTNVVELGLDSHLKNIIKTPKTKRQVKLLDDSPLLPSTEELLVVADKTPERVQDNSKTSKDNLPLALKKTPRLKKLSRKIADNFEMLEKEDNKSKTNHKLTKDIKRNQEMSKTIKTNIVQKICVDVDSDTEAEPKKLIEDIKCIGIDQFSKETSDCEVSKINKIVKSDVDKNKNKKTKNLKKSLKFVKIEKEKTDKNQEETQECPKNNTIKIRSSLRSPKKKSSGVDLKPSPAKRKKHAEEDGSNVVLEIEKIKKKQTQSKHSKHKAPEAEIIDSKQTDGVENVSEFVFTRATRHNCKTNSSIPEDILNPEKTSNNSVTRKRINPNNCDGSSNPSGLDLDAIDCDQPSKKVKVVAKTLPENNHSISITSEEKKLNNGEVDQVRGKLTRKGNLKAKQALNINSLLLDKKTNANLRNTRRGQKCNNEENLVQRKVDLYQIKNSTPRKTRRGGICNDGELVKMKVELSIAPNGSSVDNDKSDTPRKSQRGKLSTEEELVQMEEDLSAAQNSSTVESKKSDSSRKTRKRKNCNEEELVKVKVELSKAQNGSFFEKDKIQKGNEMLSKTGSENCKEEETIQNPDKALSFVKTKSKTFSKIKALEKTSLFNKIDIKEKEANKITEQQRFDKTSNRSSRCRLKPARFRDDSTDSKSSSEPSRKERNPNKRKHNDDTKSHFISEEKGNQNSTDNDDSGFTIPSERKSDVGDSSKIVDNSNRRVVRRTRTSTSSDIGRSRSGSSSSRTSAHSGTSMTLTPRRSAKKGEQVLFTGLSNSSLECSIKTLGGAVVDCPWSCSVLVTDKVRRTVKFLCVLGQGKPIVTPEWILQSRRCCCFKDPKNYLLVDLEAEEKFSFKLAETLEEAKTQPLLSDYHVYTTPSVKPPPEDIKSIVECCGGQYLAKIPTKWPKQSLIISHDEDRGLWKKLKVKGVTPTIVTPEMLLLGVLHHKLDIETHRIS